MTMLSVEDLAVGLRGGPSLVHGLSLELAAGERLALLGESGSGKTIASLSMLRLNPPPTEITGGRVVFNGVDLVTAADRELDRVRGHRIAMIYQDPLSCLNPVRPVGDQIAEAIRAHRDVTAAEARAAAIDLLGEVGIEHGTRRVRQYPHQFSGGMRQRVMIAMAISCEPEVLIADEPTTSLDVTTQARILSLLDDLATRRGMAVLFITHDLAVASGFCARIQVMREGRVVESGGLPGVLTASAHQYTRELLRSVVTLRTPVEPVEPIPEPPLIEADRLVQRFGSGDAAVDEVSLTVHRGETFGLVGESGAGKSTLTRLVLGLDRPVSGEVRHEGVALGSLSRGELRRRRRDMQLVPQDPFGSLNRRKTVEQIVGLPLQVHQRASKKERRRRVAELLDLVGLPAAFTGRYPRELSGGQCQRVNIARAIALEPSFVVLDEAVSAVDVVTRAQILRLLRDLQRELGLTYLFVSHDLAVVRQVAPRLAVMRHGRIVETGTRAELFDDPKHEYTRALIDAVPALVTGDGQVSR
ncbi:dipeptide ABC transporter ATP-binding protein [Amycolatopsis magusensis]|uniref:Peptide/nickel transport system ATP-binding protein n=1 Tax=Amycolatopsis magusensis TaxID=882444 RepID=A0ABS4Q0S0_9PSEU|nr:ABC transporter ATP-binding protein [Amycolatopsis magusensis]MBP2185264.1 peptide/nickel transport system ATP-binding protein [Amycolatopsis magusensis]